MPAPMNVKLPAPTEPVRDWERQAAEWRAINLAVHGNPDFFPLTVKAAYVVGIIHDICTCVTILLHPRAQVRATYLPAFGVFASGVELLGRCVSGAEGIMVGDRSLRTGLKWLSSSDVDALSEDQPLIKTSSGVYDTQTLAQLRHFAAHGQATAKANSAVHGLPDIDTEILSHAPPLIAGGLERRWNVLQQSDAMCNNLARANVIAFRSCPSVLDPSHQYPVKAAGERRSLPGASDMVTHMKTTIDIADALLEDARRVAAQEGVTLRALVEDGLRKTLAERASRRTGFKLRDASVRGNGTQPGIDLSNWDQIRDLIYEGHGA